MFNLFQKKFIPKALLLSPILVGFFSLPGLTETKLEVEALGSTSDYQTPSVTLRVSVLNGDQVPIEGLDQDDFILRTMPKEGNAEPKIVPFKLLPPAQQRTPAPAIVVILLDMSGSMLAPDSSGNQKYASAVTAIQEFSSWIRNSNLKDKVYLAIAPFNTSANSEKPSRKVSVESLRNSIALVSDQSAIDNQLSSLKEPDGGTNLYSSIQTTVEFLSSEFLSSNGIDLTKYSQLEATDKPRLVVIAFSDGFDTEGDRSGDRSKEPMRFNSLKQSLDKSPAITVHTLGYGDSLETIVQRPDIECNPPLNDVNFSSVANGISLVLSNCKFTSQSEYPLEYFLVDAPRLKEITGDRGIHRFPKNAEEVRSAFEDFFSSLRQYEIEYYQEDAEEGQSYEIEVSLNPNSSLPPVTETTAFRFPTVIIRPLPTKQRYIILGLTLFIGGWITVQFYNWSRQQKATAEQI